MMHRITFVVFLATTLLLLQACARSESPMQNGGLDCDGLNRVNDTKLGGLCVYNQESGVFNQALLSEIRYSFQPVATSSSSTPVGREAGTRYPIGPQQKRELARLSEQAFAQVLADRQLTKSADPGDGVLGVRGQIVDVLVEVPEDPDSGAKYLFDTVGRATIVVELYDSATNEVLLRAFDHRATERVTEENAGSGQGSQMAAIAGLWQAVLSEALNHLPN